MEVLPKVANGEASFTPQDDATATATKKLSREDGRIAWEKPAAHIARQVRAFHPWPGTFTSWQNKQLKIIEATAMSGHGKAGEVLGLGDDGLRIATGDGVLVVKRLQEEGRKAVRAQEFVAGRPGIIGMVLDS